MKKKVDATALFLKTTPLFLQTSLVVFTNNAVASTFIATLFNFFARNHRKIFLYRQSCNAVGWRAHPHPAKRLYGCLWCNLPGAAGFKRVGREKAEVARRCKNDVPTSVYPLFSPQLFGKFWQKQYLRTTRQAK
ncbi:MAG: hypothetical protein IJV06_07335 [Bacteroidaceae bacterium]|nr:hypothetical protein [Bacteroidaceae bacterium]